MNLLEKYIQWMVVIVVVYATTWGVLNSLLFHMGLQLINEIIPYFILLLILLLIYSQDRHYGLKIWGKPFFFFFLVYCMYVLADMTIFRKYPLDEMGAIPGSVFLYFRSLIMSIGYFLCAETILHHFNIRKFVVVSVIVCTIPSLVYIQFVGMDTIQNLEIERGDEYHLSFLNMGFANSPIFVICLLSWRRFFSNKLLNISFSIIISAITVYILMALGKRGPILWTIVNIMICLYFTKRKSIKSYLLLSFVIGFIMYWNFDSIIKSIKDIAPKTGERIEASVYEKDTNSRFDLDNPETSTYLIGLNNFASSPIWGNYFRLVTTYTHFRGQYPHNIFIEILMTMGVLGFIPFLFLLWKAYLNSSFIFKRRYTENQFAFLILFLSPFLMLQTSKSIVFRLDFWLPFYMLYIMRELPTRHSKLYKKIAHYI